MLHLPQYFRLRCCTDPSVYWSFCRHLMGVCGIINFQDENLVYVFDASLYLNLIFAIHDCQRMQHSAHFADTLWQLTVFTASFILLFRVETFSSVLTLCCHFRPTVVWHSDQLFCKCLSIHQFTCMPFHCHNLDSPEALHQQQYLWLVSVFLCADYRAKWHSSLHK